MKAVLFAVATFLIVEYFSGAAVPLAVSYNSLGQCPPPNKVCNNKPTCYSHADCQKWGKICCYNQFNTKSCTAPWRSGNDGHGNDKRQNNRRNGSCKHDHIFTGKRMH